MRRAVRHAAGSFISRRCFRRDPVVKLSGAIRDQAGLRVMRACPPSRGLSVLPVPPPVGSTATAGDSVGISAEKTRRAKLLPKSLQEIFAAAAAAPAQLAEEAAQRAATVRLAAGEHLNRRVRDTANAVLAGSSRLDYLGAEEWELLDKLRRAVESMHVATRRGGGSGAGGDHQKAHNKQDLGATAARFWDSFRFVCVLGCLLQTCEAEAACFLRAILAVGGFELLCLPHLPWLI
jgi:hypothetical protein